MKIGFKIWILIFALFLSILAIKPGFGGSGVLVNSVEINTTSYEQGLRVGDIIVSINGEQVENSQDYGRIIGQMDFDGSFRRIDIETKDSEYILFTNETLKISVRDIPKTNIKTGLDLRGGARALVKPDQQISESELNDLVEIVRNRLNVFGLSDVNVRGVSDLSGEKFLLVEIAGATPSDLEHLIGQQGKFEAKIGNQTVFVGGQNKDIRDVCRNDATCAAVTSCSGSAGSYFCNFAFTIYLSLEAAERHANVTSGLDLDETRQYLSERLFLYVDENEVDSLLIAASLRGQVTTEISIQGSGTGETQEAALSNARYNMKQLQTILLTGSLPYKLEIVRLDTISPKLGEEFIKSILLAGAISIVLVSLIIFARYRAFKISIALLVTSFSELIIILGVAAFIGWNLDLPSIAGILATIGTGVDQQIVMIDETRRDKNLSILQRMKRALFVIVSAYLISVASLIPLYWAGAGLFKGFALTTIIGITAGVLITRPAFADMIKRMEKN